MSLKDGKINYSSINHRKIKLQPNPTNIQVCQFVHIAKQPVASFCIASADITRSVDCAVGIFQSARNLEIKCFNGDKETNTGEPL